MADEKAILYCACLADMVRIHPLMTREYQCDRCSVQLGIFPSGQKIIADFGRANIELVCNRCRGDMLPAQNELTPEIITEVQQSVINPASKTGKN